MMMREVIHITANSSFRAFMQMNDCHPPQSFSLRRKVGDFHLIKQSILKEKPLPCLIREAAFVNHLYVLNTLSLFSPIA